MDNYDDLPYIMYCLVDIMAGQDQCALMLQAQVFQMSSWQFCMSCWH